MQVDELLDLTNWILDNIADKGISDKYRQLFALLQHNTRPNVPKQSFNQERDNLIQSLREVPINQLSFGQIEILNKLGIAKNVGIDGALLIDDILIRNAIDVASAASAVEECLRQVDDGIEWSRKQRELLLKVISAEGVSEADGGVILRVRFAGEASVNNLTDLKEWSKTWWEIGRGISIAHGKSPEEISVIGASKGSIIVALRTAAEIAGTVSFIIMRALKIAEKYYDIRRKAQEVRALKLGNDKIEKDLEEEADSYKSKGVDDIVEETSEKLYIRQGDHVNELTSAVRKLVDFITRGGEVDFVAPSDESGDAEAGLVGQGFGQMELRIRFQEVRRLEREVRQLKHPDPKASS